MPNFLSPYSNIHSCLTVFRPTQVQTRAAGKHLITETVMRLNSETWTPSPLGYYDNFPDKTMGVVVKVIKEPVEKKTLLLDKDVKAGEVIYTVSI